MVFGVPLVPLVVETGAVVLIAIWTTLLFAFLLLPIIVGMRIVTRADDQQFRLLGLRLMMRGINVPLLNRLFHCNRNGSFWQASTYTPLPLKRRK